MSSEQGFETRCVRSGYTPGKGEPVVPPIVSSVTYRYETSEQVHELFDLQAQGYFYSRIENPTVSVVEQRMAELDDAVGALMTSSGQAANLFAVLNIASAGDHILVAQSVYGGTVNLFQHRLIKLGIEATFIDNDASEDELRAAVRPNTKLLFCETLSNPVLRMVDIEMWAEVAHSNHLPLLVDNTFATPYFCQPGKFGADIITYSGTKYLDGHALQVSGMIVDTGNFSWSDAYRETGKFAELVEPDTTYKGLSYTEHFGANAYIVKARVQLMRDLGATPSPFSAFLLGNGLQTLPIRMQKHFENAHQVASYLEQHPRIRSVNFPALTGNKYHALASKYLAKGTSGVLSFEVDGGTPEEDRALAGKVINAFKLINIEVNVAEIRTCALHPATSTNRQMTDTELLAAGIAPGLIRLSVGLESVEDIIADIEQALAFI